MEISNEILQDMIDSIQSYKDVMEKDFDAGKELKDKITKKLIKINNRRSEIRKSLGFELYMLYHGLASAIIEEDFESASIVRDQINDYDYKKYLDK